MPDVPRQALMPVAADALPPGSNAVEPCKEAAGTLEKFVESLHARGSVVTNWIVALNSCKLPRAVKLLVQVVERRLMTPS